MTRCIAIDDEPIALDIIASYCEKRGGIELETYSSPKAGLARILEWLPDVVFLDIEMNGVSGLDLARKIPEGCCLIFTTAYARYALDGFEANAVDFLHKPFFYERFDNAMKKAEMHLKMKDLLRRSESPDRKLVLKSDYRNVAMSFDSIVYVESIDNYVRVHMADGSSVVSKITLSAVLERLPADEFVRIHRSFIVARSRITSFTRSEVTLGISGKTLPVGSRFSDAIKLK